MYVPHPFVRGNKTWILTLAGSLTYLLLWPDDGIMKKEDIRCCFDGSIFPRKAEAHARNQKARQNTKGIIRSVIGRSNFTSAKLVERSKKFI